MSLYAVNKVAWRTVLDEDFRNALRANPSVVLKDFEPPLSPEERDLLLNGAVGALARRGANTFLLNQLARFHMFGLDRSNYRARMVAEYADDYPDNLNEPR